MKKHSQTTTVYRIDLEKGNYTTISRDILISKELTDSAKTLLQLCLNNTNDWKLVLGHFQKLLNWSNDKMSGAVSNLIENGYLKKEKRPNGKGKGFTYIYIISEFGNLNPNRVKALQEEIIDSLDDKDDPQFEVIENDNLSELPETLKFTDLEIEEVLEEIITKAIKGYNLTNEYLDKLVNYYIDGFNSGKFNKTNFDKENQIGSIIKSIEKNINNKLEVIEKWIDFHNNRGTNNQRINIKQQALRYFKELDSPLDEVTEGDIKVKLHKLKSSIIDINRTYDSRYQD